MTQSGALDQLFDEAQVAFNVRDWIAAIDLLEKIVRINPDYLNARELLKDAYERLAARGRYLTGLGYLDTKQWTKAIEELGAAVRGDPEHGEANAKLEDAKRRARIDRLLNEADEHCRKSEWKQAAAKLEEASELAPSSAEIKQRLDDAKAKDLYQLGVRHIEAERWQVAQECFKELEQQRPGDKNVILRLAEIKKQLEWAGLYRRAQEYEEADEWSKAIVLYDRIYSQHPDYKDVVKRLARCREQNQEGPESSSAGRGSGEQSTEDRPSLPIKWRWLSFFLALILSATLILAVCRRALHCLMCYKVSEVSFVIFSAIVTFFVSLLLKRWGKLFPPIVWEALEFAALGVAPVLCIFVVTVWFSPDPSREDCSSVLRAIAVLGPSTSALCNGDFEQEFEGWQRGGELDQSVKCDGGQCYAILGSPDYPCYYGVPVGEAWIRQTLEVPQVVSPTLSLRYRVLSYDLDIPGYDYFQVTINGEQFPERYGNHEWSEPSCDREAWDSGWQTLTLDLSAYRGKEIEISFHNVNGTQAFFNTWTYVDDVRIGGVY